ncbi:MAG: phytoene desaturase family protein [Parvularculaceae bacterium]|nr:phytoene desaturase family protein [Parvularculaceae bacterium]
MAAKSPEGAPLAEKSVFIVGAGMGGLAAALRLSGRARVTVFDRAPRVGGKMREITIDGAPIDVGPTVLTMKWVFDELFAGAGAHFDTAVPTTRLDILARHFWRDGSQFDLFAEDRAALDAVGDFAGREEADGFLRFLGEARRIERMLRDSFLRAPAPDMAAMLRAAGPFQLLKVDPFTTYWSALGRYFRDARLRQLFARYATYCGSSPFKAPATLMLIAAVEKAGVWAPKEGMAGLARITAQLGMERGVIFRLGEGVAEVKLSSGRATGVITQSGERLDADAIIVNADAAAIASGLLGAAIAGAGPRMPNARSQSAITFAFSAATSDAPLDRHNVFFSDDYKAEFDSVFDRREVPRQPTTYVWAPPSAGDGAQRLFCLVNAPAGTASADKARARMIDHLAACGLSLDIKSAFQVTPQDFARDYPGTEGAIYGAPSHGWRATFERAGVRTRIPGLYLAGGSVHPGPGVPMAALSGMAAAKCLMTDFGLT